MLKAGHPELGSCQTGQAFKNVIVMEFILDKHGKKMSKHKGNVVNPFEMVDKYGSDPLRWYMLTTSSPWTPTKFDEEGLKESLRKYFDTLKNCYNFLALYANIDGIKDIAESEGVTVVEYLEKRADKPERIDRWIVSKYNSIVTNTIKELDDYELTRPLRKLSDFVIDDLSNWYVRRNRKRFWSAGDDAGKMRAYLTLYEILLGISKLTAPITPLISELLYRELSTSKTLAETPSIHMTQFPQPETSLIDEELEVTMGLVQKVVKMGRAIRAEEEIKVRQPLATMLLAVSLQSRLDLSNDSNVMLLESIQEYVSDELNIETIEIKNSISSDVYRYQPPSLIFSKAGKEYGKLVPHIKKYLETASASEIHKIQAQEPIEIKIDGESITLQPEFVTPPEKRSVKGWAIDFHSDSEIKIALNTVISDDLKHKGWVRETVNRIQNLRKQANFKVTDKIEISIVTTKTLKEALNIHEDLLRRETLAEKLQIDDLENSNGAENSSQDISQEFDINGEKATISLVRV